MFVKIVLLFLVSTMFSPSVLASYYDIYPSALDAVHTGEATVSELSDNTGGSPTWNTNSDGWMFVDKAQILLISSFDIAGHNEAIAAVQLMVKYSVESGYSGTNYLQFNNGTFTNTSTQPADGETDIEDVFDLYAAGVDTWAEIVALNLSFTNDDGGGPDGVSFDYIWIRVTYTPCSPPAAPAASNQSVCFGESTPDLSATGSNIKWYSDAGLTTLVHSGSPYSTGLTAVGTYTFYVTQTLVCESPSTTVTLAIYNVPTATASNNGPACEGGSITLTGGPMGMTNYSWSGPGSYTSSQQSPVRSGVTSAMSGTYTLTVTNSNGCSSSVSTSVVINATPSSPPINSASAVNSTDFTANWSASTGAASYYLDVSASATFSPNLPSYNNLNVGGVTSYNVTGLTPNTPYYYRVRASNSCGTSSNSGNASCTTVPNYSGIIVSGNLTVNNSTIDQTNDPAYITMNGTTKHIDGTGAFQQIKLRVSGTIAFDGVISSGIFQKTLVDASNTYTVISGRTFKNIEFTNNGITILQATSVFENSGDWTNNSNITADLTSTVKFNGTAAQTVKSGGSNYGNVEIINTVLPSVTDGIVLSDDMPVAATLTLTDGTIITGTNKVYVSNSGADKVAEGAGNTDYLNSWVYGNIRRNMTVNTGSYDFPVGSEVNSFLAKLKNNSAFSDVSFIDAFFDRSPATLTVSGITNLILSADGGEYKDVSDGGIWVLTPSGGTDKNYDLSLYFNIYPAFLDDLYDNGFGILSRTGSNLTDPNEWNVTNLGTLDMVTGRLVTDGYAFRQGLTTFSHKGIGVLDDSGLPIELASFSAECLAEEVLISWVTESENNNDYFTLEKSSDGNDFMILATVNGAGSHNSELKYVYNDFSPFNMTYYRLKQTDFDGKFSYSDVISTSCNNSDPSFEINNISENSTGNNDLIVNYTSDKNEVYIVLIDMLGHEIYRRMENSSDGLNKTTISTKNFPAGVYILMMNDSSRYISKKVIIRK